MDDPEFVYPEGRRVSDLWSRPACTLRLVEERWYHRLLDKLPKRTDRGYLLGNVTFDVYIGPGGISAAPAVVTMGTMAEAQIRRRTGI